MELNAVEFETRVIAARGNALEVARNYPIVFKEHRGRILLSLRNHHLVGRVDELRQEKVVGPLLVCHAVRDVSGAASDAVLLRRHTPRVCKHHLLLHLLFRLCERHRTVLNSSHVGADEEEDFISVNFALHLSTTLQLEHLLVDQVVEPEVGSLSEIELGPGL